MPDYLLPCECGREVVVSRAQAGGTVLCECGAKLTVPTLRGIAELRSAPVASGAARRNWDDRHRVGFLLALGAVTCVLVAGYLWSSLPELTAQPTEGDYTQFVAATSPSDLFFIHHQAVQGLGGLRPADENLERVRQLMSWGIGIVLAMGLAASAGACIVVWNKK